MTIDRRDFLQLAVGAAGLGAARRAAKADTYPTRPVRLVLPFPPGGAFDIIGRPWADKVSKGGTLGTVFVENQPGAGGAVRHLAWTCLYVIDQLLEIFHRHRGIDGDAEGSDCDH